MQCGNYESITVKKLESMEGLWKWQVKKKKKADKSKKLHYACKHCLTSPHIFTIECGHHASKSCEPVSVHKRVTETTKHLTPSSSQFTRKDRTNWECSLKVSQGWQTNITVLKLWAQQDTSVPSRNQRTTEVTGGHEGVREGGLTAHKSCYYHFTSTSVQCQDTKDVKNRANWGGNQVKSSCKEGWNKLLSVSIRTTSNGDKLQQRRFTLNH